MIPNQFISISKKVLPETARFLFFSMRHFRQLNLSFFLTVLAVIMLYFNSALTGKTVASL